MLLWFINVLIKNSGSDAATLVNKSAANYKIKQNQQLAEEFDKLIIRKFFLKKELFIPHLKIIFGVLILVMYN